MDYAGSTLCSESKHHQQHINYGDYRCATQVRLRQIRYHKIGRWFDEAQDRWIEAEPIMTQEQKEALDRWIGAEPITTQEQKGAHDRWSQHKYGLCLGCKVGLDDKADFTFNYSFSSEHGTMMCHACNEKLNQQFQKYCTNCFNAVNEGDVVIGSLHPISKQRVVTFCRRC